MTTETQQPAPVPAEVVESRPHVAILLRGELDAVVQAVPQLLARLRRNGGKRGPKLNHEIASAIRQRLAAGERMDVLSKELGVGVKAIENVASGRTYPQQPSA